VRVRNLDRDRPIQHIGDGVFSGDAGRRIMTTAVADDKEAARLMGGMKRDGIPLSEREVLEAVEDPRWEAAGGVRDWRVYVPGSVRGRWGFLPLPARLCVFETAELMALSQEVGAAMVTGPVWRPATR
jgi:hypothetical protein